MRLLIAFSQKPVRAAATLWLLALLLAACLAGLLPDTLLAPDLLHSNAPPFTPGHLFGTDPLGQDVLVALIYGARTTLLVSLPAATGAALLGTLLGGMAGYWGNRSFRLLLAYWLAGGAALLSYILLRPTGTGYNTLWWPLALLVAAAALGWCLQKLPALNRFYAFPIDAIVLAAVALLGSIPRLLLILTVAASVEPTVAGLVVLLIFTFWPAAARLVRAEVLRVRRLSYVDAAHATGLPTSRILLRHILPNVWGPIRTAWPLSVATIITLETTLSFLGVGLPPEIPSWGRLLATSRLATSSWWLLVLPALCLLATTLSLRALVTKREA